MLVIVAAAFITHSTTAVIEPFQNDYGEGIVLYQASKIDHLAGAYKPIDQYPYVVFHYPPVYHLALITVAKWTGNMLLAGRSVSFVSGLLIQLTFGLLVFFCLPRRLDPFSRYGAAIFSALLPNALPVMMWTRLARVDALAVLLSFAGAALFVVSVPNGWRQYLACVLFVGAVFTKQTTVAAPLACFMLALAIDAKKALKLCVFTVILGGGVLAGLSWMTSGEV